MKNVYIGVAWPYSYAPFHIGNLYGSHYPADIYARFRKLCGDRVVMVSGSDMHGTPITLAAEKAGVAPEYHAEQYHALNSQLLQDLHIEYSLFTTTATANHTETVHEMFLTLLKNGYIGREVSKQLFSEQEQKFMQDRYVEGTCPFCGFDSARGDQCDNCGKLIDSLELKNPKSKTTGDSLVVRETENYVLELGKLEGKLGDWLLTKDGTWPEWILSETRGWLKDGLRSRAITRDMSYGVSIPVDKISTDMHISGIENKVFYVWFEAVIGYLSACKEWAKLHDQNWEDFFEGNTSESVYFVGEDNLVFHTINWPSQLLGTAHNYTLPTEVFVNKFLMLEGQKISKSRNWIVDVEHMLVTYSLDSIRFYLAYIMVGNDQTSFRWDDFMNVTNGVFMAKIGNLVHRVLTFTVKNFGEAVSGDQELDEDVLKKLEETFVKVEKSYRHSKVREALLAVVELCEFCNEYLTKHEFWKLFKEDEAGAKKVVYSVLQVVYNLPTLLYPIIPDFSKRLSVYFGEHLVVTEGQNKFVMKKITDQTRLELEILPLVMKIEEEQIVLEKENLGKVL